MVANQTDTDSEAEAHGTPLQYTVQLSKIVVLYDTNVLVIVPVYRRP